MALKNIETYIMRRGLVKTVDPAVKKPIYRKPGFEGIVSLSTMEERLSLHLRRKRDEQWLNRSQVGMMVGIHAEIYARHERAGAKLSVARLLHLAELLDFSPIEAIHAVTPQFFGEDQDDADLRLALMMKSLAMSASTAKALLDVVEALPRSGSQDEGSTRAESTDRA